MSDNATPRQAEPEPAALAELVRQAERAAELAVDGLPPVPAELLEELAEQSARAAELLMAEQEARLASLEELDAHRAEG